MSGPGFRGLAPRSKAFGRWIPKNMQPIYGYVWTEYLEPRMLRVVAAHRYPTSDEEQRIPEWSRKHHYITICGSLDELQGAFERRVADLEAQHCLVDEQWLVGGEGVRYDV